MDTAIYLPWTLDSDKQTMCFVFWRYMVSALHIYSYFWSFNPSCRLLDKDIEPGLWHSRWNQVMHGVTRANSGNPQCFLYSLDNWTQEPAVRPDNWIWLMQLSPGNAYTFLVFMSREVVCFRNWLNDARYLFAFCINKRVTLEVASMHKICVFDHLLLLWLFCRYYLEYKNGGGISALIL